MAIHRHCYIDGRTKRSWEQRQRLGGNALPRAKPRRTSPFGRWNERSDENLKQGDRRVACRLRRKERLTVES